MSRRVRGPYAPGALTHERLLEVAHYDPDTGNFTARLQRGPRLAGHTLGCKHSHGYVQIVIDGERFFRHRLAWFYAHGEWPKNNIDHIDMDKSNDRLANLREATQSENLRNARCRAASGLKGAYWDKKRKVWFSTIHINHKNISLGTYATAEEAHAAYMKAAREASGEFARAA